MFSLGRRSENFARSTVVSCWAALTDFWRTQQTNHASMAIQQTVSGNLTFALQNKELLEMGNFSCQKDHKQLKDIWVLLCLPVCLTCHWQATVTLRGKQQQFLTQIMIITTSYLDWTWALRRAVVAKKDLPWSFGLSQWQGCITLFLTVKQN